ncbi:hypothetical protein ElyMa_001945700 [Elysia marginata]|uniref:Uncharacterized protein n=1 Tax=Elysia marginata TaxID=1093978 RepID=A0AAV4EYZ9_9GAST|nr:hypothetical protein ElyMa_001945700 [Elysia marginata]
MNQRETEEVLQRFCTGSLDREAGLHAAYKHPQTFSEAVAYSDDFQRRRDAVYYPTNYHEVDGRTDHAVNLQQKYDSHRFVGNRDHAPEPPRDEIYHHTYHSPDSPREDHLSGDSHYSQEPYHCRRFFLFFPTSLDGDTTPMFIPTCHSVVAPATVIDSLFVTPTTDVFQFSSATRSRRSPSACDGGKIGKRDEATARF